MHATAKAELVLEVGEEGTEAGAGDLARLARAAMSSELPGLAIGLMTIFYLASSLIGLM